MYQLVTQSGELASFQHSERFSFVEGSGRAVLVYSTCAAAYGRSAQTPVAPSH